jgi:hypothetical protein
MDNPGGEEIVNESYAKMRKFNCWNISIVQQYSRFQTMQPETSPDFRLAPALRFA